LPKSHLFLIFLHPTNPGHLIYHEQPTKWPKFFSSRRGKPHAHPLPFHVDGSHYIGQWCRPSSPRPLEPPSLGLPLPSYKQQ
jgi:hypothetical protein